MLGKKILVGILAYTPLLVAKEIPFERLGDDNPTMEIARFFEDWDLKKHGQYLGTPRNYGASLSPEERNDIRYIVTFLADRSLVVIAAHRSNLEEAGDRIDHIHPLKFLMTVFTDEELKVGIRRIRGRGWIWNDFIGGIKASLITEAGMGNVNTNQAGDFARAVGVNVDLIAPALQRQDWEEFVDLLITHVPRKGDPGRYDN